MATGIVAAVTIDHRDVDALADRRARGDEIWIVPDRHAAEATAPASATLCAVFSRYDDTYCAYAYLFDGAIYKFGWEAPGDQTHRALSRPTAAWYDAPSVGDTFAIRVDPARPHRHAIVEPPFTAMGRGVYYFGRQPA